MFLLRRKEEGQSIMNMKHLGYLVCCSEVFDSCNIANYEYKEDWKYMKKESKKHAMEKYTLSK